MPTYCASRHHYQLHYGHAIGAAHIAAGRLNRTPVQSTKNVPAVCCQKQLSALSETRHHNQADPVASDRIIWRPADFIALRHSRNYVSPECCRISGREQSSAQVATRQHYQVKPLGPSTYDTLRPADFIVVQLQPPIHAGGRLLFPAVDSYV